MLIHLGKWTSYPLSPFSPAKTSNKSPLILEAAHYLRDNADSRFKALKTDTRNIKCSARRRSIRDDGDDDEDEDDEYGYNEEIALLEMYTQSVTDEVLMVNAMVDQERVDVVIFKGFSSCLSYKTSADPSRSVLPKKAIIESIDRIRGPFNPSDFQYIQKGLTFDEFKTHLKTLNQSYDDKRSSAQGTT